MSSSGLCVYKDEVTELKYELNSKENERNPVKYKQLIQQVILYMTKGIDMTPLFTTIVKAAASKDLVQKKLCYLYLCHYASSHSELALLTVNTLKIDAEDTNYMVRGLALRSIGSLRLASLVEYTKDVMLKGLKDHSAYVRKAAVIGCLQLFKLAPHEINEDDVIKQLNERLKKDKDIEVRRNCMFVLEEMLTAVNDTSKLHHFLLKRLQKFDEWGLQFSLDVLMRCRPQDEKDIFRTLNSLDTCLKHANTSVVLGAVRVFLHYTTELTELRDDVFDRIKVPLLTALSSKSPEIAYAVVCHIEIILQQAPALFEDSISSFYCRYNDPLYLKIKKLEALSKLVTESNGKQILGELSYHAQDRETASHSIYYIGMMALLHPELADMCIEKLFLFLQSRDDCIVSHSLTALRDLVIKYDKYSVLMPNISKYLKRDLLPDGKATVLWMLGEFGENIPEAPYVLEEFSDDIEKETSPVVKTELLTAAMKLFFKRPPECQAMLGHLLEYCIEQEYNIDIRDRALLYYRLLKVDVNKAKEVVCCQRSAQFIDNANIVMIDSNKLLLNEFNTMSVVYGQLSAARQERKVLNEKTNQSRQERSVADDSKDLDSSESKHETVSIVVDTNLVEIDEDRSEVKSVNSSSKELLAHVDQNMPSLDENIPIEKENGNQLLVSENDPLLPIDDNLDLEENVVERDLLPRNDSLLSEENDTNDMNLMSERAMPVNDNLALMQEEREDLPHLSSQTFESLWTTLPESESYEIELDEIPDQNGFLELLADRKIYTMASTPPDAEHKRYFLYAKSDCNILCEVSIDSTTLNLKTVIKMEDPTNVHCFIEVFQNCLVDVLTT